jgi:hypothetical protein
MSNGKKSYLKSTMSVAAVTPSGAILTNAVPDISRFDLKMHEGRKLDALIISATLINYEDFDNLIDFLKVHQKCFLPSSIK